MNREEEIQKAIEEEFEDHLFEDESDYIMQSSKFKKGILWADKNPKQGLWDSEKLIKWLKNNSHKYVVCDESDFSYYAYNSLIEDLRKAMEEQTMPNEEYPHNDCLKALALLRMDYNPEDGLYSKWIYESLSYVIKRIAEVDHINTYIGKERIP